MVGKLFVKDARNALYLSLVMRTQEVNDMHKVRCVGNLLCVLKWGQDVR